jgi:hypothetical protein
MAAAARAAAAAAATAAVPGGVRVAGREGGSGAAAEAAMEAVARAVVRAVVAMEQSLVGRVAVMVGEAIPAEVGSVVATEEVSAVALGAAAMVVVRVEDGVAVKEVVVTAVVTVVAE